MKKTYVKKIIAASLVAAMAVSVPVSVSAAGTDVAQTDSQQGKANSAGKTIYVQTRGNGDGTSESSPTDFVSALQKAKDGDTIKLIGIVSSTIMEPLTITKAVTIEGNAAGSCLEVRGGVIELGADVTFKNLDLGFGHYPSGVMDMGSDAQRAAVSIYASGHTLTLDNVTMPVYDTGYRILPNLVAGAMPNGKAPKGNNATINLIDPNGKLNVRNIYGTVGGSWSGDVTVNLQGKPSVHGNDDIPRGGSNDTPLTTKKPGEIAAGLNNGDKVTGTLTVVATGTGGSGATVGKIDGTKATTTNVTYKDGSTVLPELTGITELNLQSGAYRTADGQTATLRVTTLNLPSGGTLNLMGTPSTTLVGNFVGGGSLWFLANGDLNIAGNVSGSTSVRVLGNVQTNRTYITAKKIKEKNFYPEDTAGKGKVVGADSNEWQLEDNSTESTIASIELKTKGTPAKEIVKPSELDINQGNVEVKLGDFTAKDALGKKVDAYDNSFDPPVVVDENGNLTHLVAVISDHSTNNGGNEDGDFDLMLQACDGEVTDSNPNGCKVPGKHEIIPGLYTVQISRVDGMHLLDYQFEVVEESSDKLNADIQATGVKVERQLALTVGDMQHLTPAPNPSNARPKTEGTDFTYTYTSNNEEVATVDTKGKVTAKKPGTATITVTMKGGEKDVTNTCSVTVTPDLNELVTSISLDKLSLSLNLKDKKEDTLTATVEKGGQNVTDDVTWSSSNDAIATVDANGKVTAKKAGSAIITATSKTDSSYQATCPVVVIEPGKVELPENAGGALTGNGVTKLVEAGTTSNGDRQVSVPVGSTEGLSMDADKVKTGLTQDDKTVTFEVGKKVSTYKYFYLTFKKEEVTKAAEEKKALGLDVSVQENLDNQNVKKSTIDIQAGNLDTVTKPDLKFPISEDLKDEKFHLYFNDQKVGTDEYTPQAVSGAAQTREVVTQASPTYYVTVPLEKGSGNYTLKVVSNNTGGSTGGNTGGTTPGGSTPGGSTGGSTGSSTNNRPSSVVNRPSTPSTPSTTTPSVTPGNTNTALAPRLDTSSVNMVAGGGYAFLVRGNNDTANIKVEVSNPAIAGVTLENGSDSRGAKYRVVAKGTGTTQILVTVNGKTTSMLVNVVASKGSITLDTAQYTMKPGDRYTIGAFLKDGNGNPLTAEQVRAMVNEGKLQVRDSRTGSIVDLEQLSTGNFRVTGKKEGTAYIIYEVGGTHASVRIDVQNGATAGGNSVRNTSHFIQ